MLIGNPNIFAIECYHEPISTNTWYVFGRMCIWTKGIKLGDIDEPDCMLNVTELALLNTFNKHESLENNALAQFSDKTLFDFLNHALYIDDEVKTYEEIRADAEKYFKFDFLTNGGESFDRTKSFAISDGNNIRLLFTDSTEKFHSSHFPKQIFLDVITSFFAWMKNERQNVGS
jgi:hypothetical protein